MSAGKYGPLTPHMQRHGGVVHDNIDESRVIIVNEEAVENYSRFYRFSPRVDVEPPGFISKCINDNAYGHWRPPPRAMGGRPHNPERPPQEYVHQHYSQLTILNHIIGAGVLQPKKTNSLLNTSLFEFPTKPQAVVWATKSTRSLRSMLRRYSY